MNTDAVINALQGVTDIDSRRPTASRVATALTTIADFEFVQEHGLGADDLDEQGLPADQPTTVDELADRIRDIALSAADEAESAGNLALQGAWDGVWLAADGTG